MSTHTWAIEMFTISPMRKAKSPKTAGFLRSIVAANLNALMEHNLKEKGDKPRALQEISGVRKSTIQRILSQEVGANMETLEALAAAFHLSGYQLLIPELNPRSPQQIPGAWKTEERLYRAWRQSKVTNVIPLPRKIA